MSHNLTEDEADDMLNDYDFSGGVRGKYAEAFQQGYTIHIQRVDGTVEERHFVPSEGVVRLDPEVRAYFPDAQSVNKALRGLIELIPTQPTPNKTD